MSNRIYSAIADATGTEIMDFTAGLLRLISDLEIEAERASDCDLDWSDYANGMMEMSLEYLSNTDVEARTV
ncbi:hypothetical protein [uncultured Sulfitobacter sp.]|uniref:hypothetical protein n=1 Tax=uncultured Sulfitobacter sp. TaxID=191468 RepID=UPI002601F4EF|nr:hypothetical protein [uncultured Sulfitobacter sp.]